MRKVWTIAKREYGAMVATKAFLVSITLMPIMMFGGIFITKRMEQVRDVSAKRLVIVDGTGGALFGDLESAVKSRNAEAKASGEPAYQLERFAKDAIDDEERLALADRVRSDELKAFVEAPADLASVNAPTSAPPAVKYYGQNAMLSEERRWLERVVNEAVSARRLVELKLDAAAVKRATAPTPVLALGLPKRGAEGKISGGDEKQGMAGLFVPLGFMMLMFMVIFLAAQPLLEGVMEEKGGRIAEVLLGSVSAFQLMLGKLLGNIAGSLSVVAIYATGGYLAAWYNGWTGYVPMEFVPWFVAFQVMGVLLFSSIFLAVGAAVTQAKEAQSMLLPVWLLMCLPMFTWLQIVREPNGPIATWGSFFPPATPLVMVLRLSSEAVIPAWQPWASLALLAVTTVACIYVAGRVFRIGILWQGKSPKFSELARWAFRG